MGRRPVVRPEGGVTGVDVPDTVDPHHPRRVPVPGQAANDAHLAGQRSEELAQAVGRDSTPGLRCPAGNRARSAASQRSWISRSRPSRQANQSSGDHDASAPHRRPRSGTTSAAPGAPPSARSTSTPSSPRRARRPRRGSSDAVAVSVVVVVPGKGPGQAAHTVQGPAGEGVLGGGPVVGQVPGDDHQVEGAEVGHGAPDVVGSGQISGAEPAVGVPAHHGVGVGEPHRFGHGGQVQVGHVADGDGHGLGRGARMNVTSPVALGTSSRSTSLRAATPTCDPGGRLLDPEAIRPRRSTQPQIHRTPRPRPAALKRVRGPATDPVTVEHMARHYDPVG